MSLVSVLIPVYQAAAHIGTAIRSALAQPEVGEVIVIDDASRDGSADAALAADDGSGRLRIRRLAQNSGPGTARNIALEMAQMPLVALLDADDLFVPGRFARLLGVGNGNWDFVADNIAFVSSPTDPIPPDWIVPKIIPSRWLQLRDFIEENISNPFRLRAEMGFLKPVMRRSVLEKFNLRYDPSLRLGEDFLLYSLALVRGARFSVTSGCGYLAVVRDESLSARHAISDLRAQADADHMLIAEARARGLPEEDIRLICKHLKVIEDKVLVRQFLEDRKRQGRAGALVAQMTQPGRLARTVRMLIRDRMAMRWQENVLPRRLIPERFFQPDDRFQ